MLSGVSTTALKLSASRPRLTPEGTSSRASSPAFAVRASAQKKESTILSSVGSGLAALGLAATLQFAPAAVGPARADEFRIVASPPPLETHYFDDAGVLSRVTRSDLKRLLTGIEEETGFHIDVVTLRKVAGKGDVFELADKILETWYPTIEEGDKRGVVLLVTSAKEGAVAGGPTFLDTIGDDVLEGVITENLPVLAVDEKYNEAIYSTAKRLVARIRGQPDIPGPQFQDQKRESNFQTREQTENKRDQFVFVVGGLLVIAFVVPMLQFFAYTGAPKLPGRK